MVLAPPLRQENVPETCMHMHFGEGVAGVSLPDEKSESRELHFRLSPFLFVARLGGLIRCMRSLGEKVSRALIETKTLNMTFWSVARVRSSILVPTRNIKPSFAGYVYSG